MITELTQLGQLVMNFGAAGLIAWVFYRLVDKWAEKFLQAQAGQTSAMVEQAHSMAALAAAVREGQTDQRDVLIAVRALARQMEEQKNYLVEIGKGIQRGTA